MRATPWKRWASCALALSICIPAVAAARGEKSLDDCTAVDQADKDDETVELTVHNSCTVPIDCRLSWRVVCAPDSKKRRSVKPGSKKLSLAEMTTQSASISAAPCGDDAWTIDQVAWSCEPNRD